jgi:hypothetical protein
MEGEAIDNIVYDGYEQDFYLTQLLAFVMGLALGS